MIAALVLVASLVPAGSDWYSSFEDGDTRVTAIDSTAKEFAAGTGSDLGYGAGQRINIPLDCTYLLATESRRELTCWPSNGIGSFTPDPGGWIIYDGAGQPIYEPLAREATPLILTWSDVATLPIQSGTVEVPNSLYLINVQMISYSTATPHTLNATILDTPVEVRLTPTSWTWHYGQDIPDFTTTTPGGPYPDKTVTGIYTHAEDGLTVTATITWNGEYRIADSQNWYPYSAPEPPPPPPPPSRPTNTAPTSSPPRTTTAPAPATTASPVPQGAPSTSLSRLMAPAFDSGALPVPHLGD